MQNFSKLAIALAISSVIPMIYADNYQVSWDSANSQAYYTKNGGTRQNIQDNKNLAIESGSTVDIDLGSGSLEVIIIDGNNNTMNFKSGNITKDGVGGGYSYGAHTVASNNVANVFGGNIAYDLDKNDKDAKGVMGGFAESGSTSHNNEVNISGGKMFAVFGGMVAHYEATGSAGNCNGGAKNNTVNVSGGTIKKHITGGFVFGCNGDATNNTVNYTGGTVEGTIWGGRVTGNESNKTVGTGEDIKGNSLNIGESLAKPVKMNSLKAGNIANFEYINFYLPSTVKHGDTALELTTTENTDLSKSTVSAYLENATNLTKDSKINLIKKTGTSGVILSDGMKTNTKNVRVSLAGLINVKANIAVTDDKKALQLGFSGEAEKTDNSNTNNTANNTANNTSNNTNNNSNTENNANSSDAKTADNSKTANNNSTATASATDKKTDDDSAVSNNIPSDDNTDTVSNEESYAETNSKLILESQLTGVSMLEQGGNFLDDTISTTKPSNAGVGAMGAYPFVNVGGFNKRMKTGSHIDVKGVNLNLGVGADNGALNGGVFLEYGKGNWDSHLDNGSNGSGNSHYVGAGLFGQYNTQSGFYTEGSLRGGKVKTKSDKGVYDKYDLSSGYFGLHAGVGQKVNAGNNELDIYGKYYYLHTGSDSFNMKGVDVNVNSVNSNRIKLGIKDSINFDDNNALYVGAAYQYAFNGKAKETLSIKSLGESAEMTSPKLKGSTGIAELGYQYTNKGFEFAMVLRATLEEKEA